MTSQYAIHSKHTWQKSLLAVILFAAACSFLPYTGHAPYSGRWAVPTELVYQGGRQSAQMAVSYKKSGKPETRREARRCSTCKPAALLYFNRLVSTRLATLRLQPRSATIASRFVQRKIIPASTDGDAAIKG